MLFNTIEYFLFIVITFFVYWFLIKNQKGRNVFLLVVSYVFYGWWDWRFLGLIIVSTLLDYWIGQKLSKSENKKRRISLLLTSLIFNLGALVIFKYYNFFVDSLFEIFPNIKDETLLINVILPVGISFYTFQTLSYSIDVYRGKIEANNDIVAFAAFVCFFPQLVAGPIERAKDLLPQFSQVKKLVADAGFIGMKLILWGLFKKTVIADNVSVHVDKIFDNYESYDSSVLILGAFLFSTQIYCDFSGYSDIAIGSAKLFGFDLSRNFKFPYFSKGIAEFWKKWHISLTNWFKDYVYIPLGGNRVSTIKVIRNTLIVFIVSGVWHGANWTYVVWGVMHGLFFIPVLLLKAYEVNATLLDKKILAPFRIVMTFVFVSILWIVFRAESIQQASGYLEGIIHFETLNPVVVLKEVYGFITWNRCLYIFPLIFVLYAIEYLNRNRSFGLDLQWKRGLNYVTYCLVFFLWFFFGNYPSEDFIYFQF